MKGYKHLQATMERDSMTTRMALIRHGDTGKPWGTLVGSTDIDLKDGAVESAKGPLKGPLTVSVGVATYPGDSMEKTQLIQKADDALYAAKRAGKNKTVLWSADLDSVGK